MTSRYGVFAPLNISARGRVGGARQDTESPAFPAGDRPCPKTGASTGWGQGEHTMSRLLVVEDDPDIALALRLLFSRAGYEVAHAGDGRTGLKEAYAEHPDLVVLDVGLPEMDGWQVLERLRDVSDVPVL